MSINGLDAALSGLRTAQQQLNVISANVSNVGTPGFTRKILPQETLVISGESSGVRGSPIIRKVDMDLSRDYWTQVSSVSFYDVQAAYMNQIQEFHGDPAAGVNVAAEIAELKDSFSALSDSPEDNFLQRQAVNQAVTVAKKINELSNLLTQMRNDAQTEIKASVSTINTRLQTISNMNQEIRFATSVGKSTAALEDQRDQAVQALAQEIEISFFKRGDGVMVVQTKEGVQLAAEMPETVTFTSGVLGPSGYYPVSAGALVVGDPSKQNNVINITERGVGGKIGALLNMRDDVIPRQQALADEMAHKLAMRFEQQGLRLFTDPAGIVPADTAPIPVNPPAVTTPTPVTYVGFAASIKVNSTILADNTLVQKGTVGTDLPVQPGSNEVVRRILNFTFGDVAYQQVNGTRDLRASGAGDTLQEWLGIFSENKITGTADLRVYSDLNALISAGGEAFLPPAGPPLTDQFQMTFAQPETGLGPFVVTVSLSAAQANFPIGGAVTDALDQLIGEINAQITAAGIPVGLATAASRNAYGQLVIDTRADMDLTGSILGGMQQAGLNFLGLKADSYEATDPYIDVQIGNDPTIRVSIAPDDDEADLLAKLDKISAVDAGVPGLGVALDPLTGLLTMRPGDSTTTPAFGGDLRITGGAFSATGAGTAGGIAAGVNIVEALFGSAQPISNVGYSSLDANGNPVGFRSQNLGPGANLDTGIITPSNILDYAQKMVGRQTEEAIQVDTQREDETSFQNVLSERLLNESGVNIDEELAQMIVVQTAYSAAARVISAIQDQFEELLNSV